MGTTKKIMTDVTADYHRIVSLTDAIVVTDVEGHPSSFGTLDDYEVFIAGVRASRLTLYDEVERRWVVEAGGKP